MTTCIRLLALAILCQSSLALAAPRLTCEEPTFDFGTRDTSEVVSHTFVLKNTGDSDLIITSVRAACGCTATALSKQSIPPGDSANVSTKLNLSGRAGALRKTIRIESNDPATPSLELALTGKTADDFDIQPPTLVLRKANPTQPASGFVRIKANDRSTFNISETVSASGTLKLRADPIPGENAYQLSASCDSDLAPGQHADTVTVTTSLKGGKTLSLPALVIVPAPIAIAPSKIVLEENPETPVSRMIVLKAPTSEKLEIARVDTPDPGITTKAQALGSFGIRLLIANLLATSTLDGKTIQVYLKSGQIVDIPIQVKPRT